MTGSRASDPASVPACDCASDSDLLQRWSDDLAAWAIPEEIVQQASTPPWAHAVATFTVVGEVADSPSHRVARTALGPGGSVLDIGCGGGRASAALIPPARMVVGVDHQQEMLDAFAAMADERGARHHAYLGDWPQISDQVPECDVVVSHHVAYNVPAIGPFLQALDSHARTRVVLEVPMHHPLSRMSPLWKHFWDLDRPTRPSALDLHTIALALGFEAHLELWEDPAWGNRSQMTFDDAVEFTRLKLCLPPERASEVAKILPTLPVSGEATIATIWWDS